MSWNCLKVALFFLFTIIKSQEIFLNETFIYEPFQSRNTSSNVQLPPIAGKSKREITSASSDWGHLVRDGKFEEVVKFIKSSSLQSTVLDLIVRDAFDGSDLSAIQLIELSNKLLNIQRNNIYYFLYNESLKNPNTKITFKTSLRLVFKIKELIGAADAANAAIQQIWSEIPDGMRGIVTGKEVLMKNEGYPSWYYMVVSDKYDDDRDTVLASKNVFDKIMTYKWQFTPIFDGQSFLIKSGINSLYVADNYFAFNEDDRRVFVWKKGYPEDPGVWEIVDHDWRNGYYKLYNHRFNAFLGVREKMADFRTDQLSGTDVSMPNNSRLVYTNRKNTTERPIIWKVVLHYKLMVKKYENVNAIMSDCVQSFLEGNFKMSIDKFIDLGDPLLIKDVIKAVYQKSNIAKIYNYLSQFLWNLGSKSLQQLIYYGSDALLHEMKTSPGDELGVFLIDKLLKKLPQFLSGSLAIEEGGVRGVLETKSKLIPVGLKQWAELITSNREEVVNEMFDGHPDIKNKYIIRVAQEIFDGSETRSLLILRMSKSLQPQVSAQVSIALNKMIESSEKHTLPVALALAHRVYTLLDFPENENGKVSDVLHKMPWYIQAVVKKDPVCIRSTTITPYYLHVKNHFDDKRDRVMATNNPDELNISIKWVFEPDDLVTSFRIRSYETGDYLYAAADFFAFSKDKRQLFTWRPSEKVDQGVWKLVDSNWKKNKFLIYNSFFGEYMNINTIDTSYASDLDLFRHQNAYLWRRHEPGPYSEFKFERDCP